MEHHIQCDAKDISRYVFVPGAHGRARQIAASFQEARLVSESRGYLVFSGWYDGIFMTVCATGMGGPAVAIAVEELAHMGADTFIRVGSCGVLQQGLTAGDVIISTGSVRLGGTASRYLPLEFPAVPTFQVLRELAATADELAVGAKVGLVVSSDAFYDPTPNTDLFRAAHVLGIEMESDTLFVVGQYRGYRTGALFAADGTANEIKPAWGQDAFKRGEGKAIAVALRAMARIAQSDAS